LVFNLLERPYRSLSFCRCQFFLISEILMNVSWIDYRSPC
jgi:hypothetical protein